MEKTWEQGYLSLAEHINIAVLCDGKSSEPLFMLATISSDPAETIAVSGLIIYITLVSTCPSAKTPVSTTANIITISTMGIITMYKFDS